MIKRILVGLGDVESSGAATQQGVELAKRHGAEITAVTVVDHNRLDNVGPVPIGGGGAARQLREYRRKITRDAIEKAIGHFKLACNEAGIRFRLICEEGEPFDRMISAARYHDLIITGLEHLFEHGVIDEPPDELVRLVECGVRPLLAVGGVSRPVHKALIAYSGSMESAKAMRRFCQLRIWPDVKLRIVTFDGARGDPEKLLADAAAYCGAHGLQAETEQSADAARDGLLEHARQWDTDLIVLGNSARSLLMKKLFGQTALHVITNTDRPLFLSQ